MRDETMTDAEMDDVELTKPLMRTIQVRHQPADLMLTPAFDLETAKNRLTELEKFVDFYMIKGEDYGTIPGTPKPTLYKSGADKLCDIYALADTYRITNRTEDWDKNLFDYEVQCTLLSKRTGGLVATGLGSCNSYEGKYRWRENKRKCPACGKETIIKGRVEYGGGWLCWRKEGKSDGCGAKFNDDDQAIAGQMVGKTQNDDIPTLKNTLLKMAKKRAKIDAVLSATRSSGLFTQDVEDISNGGEDPEPAGSKQAAQAVATEKLKTAAKGNETATITPYKEGFVALSGPGLPIVRANMDNKMLAELGWKWEGKIALIPTGKAFDFQSFCKKHGVVATLVDTMAAERADSGVPKANLPPFTPLPPSFPNGGGQKSTDPVIKSTKRIKGNKPGAKEFLSVEWNGKTASCFNKALWPHLEHHKDRPAVLTLETKGQYTNVVGIVSLDGAEFFEEPPIKKEAKKDKDEATLPY